MKRLLTSARVLAVYLIIFTQMLDTSVANLALNNIASDLYLDVYYSGWIMTSFGAGLVISFSLGGILAKRYSGDTILAIGSLAFIAASLGCGMSSGAMPFLAFRFLQGLSSGAVIIVAQSRLFQLLGEQQRAFAISLWTSAISLAPVTGPLVGAWITAHLSWHWLFLMNVPLMSISVIVLLPVLRIEKTNSEVGKTPTATLVWFALAVASMQYVLDFGEQLSWFASTSIRIGAVVSVVSLLAFLRWNAKYPLFQFDLFRDASFAVATSVMCLGNGLIFASLIFLPLWMQRDCQMPIATAGIIVSSASGVAALASPALGRYLPKRWFGMAATLSLAATALSFALMSRFSLHSSTTTMVLARLVAGVGLAMFSLPLTTLSLANIPIAQAAKANAMSMMLRVVSANFFIAIGFASFTHLRHARELDYFSAADRITNLKYASGIPDGVMGYMSHVFNTDAMTQMFLFAAVVFALFACLVAPLGWLLMQRRSG